MLLLAGSSLAPSKGAPASTSPVLRAGSVGAVGPLPAAHVNLAGVCRVAGVTGTTPGGRSLHVPRRPWGVVATWLPGIDARSCRTARTEGGPGAAGSLAAAIDRARPVATGSYSCPAGFGTAVELTFLRSDGQRAAEVYATLTGCAWLSANGDASRWLVAGVRDALRPLAPPAWRDQIGR